MPVILAPDEQESWLDPGLSMADAQALLRPCPPEWLEAFPVSRAVNRVGNDGPECVERLAVLPGF
jgi:putative SOS response-associated peptidase YedK